MLSGSSTGEEQGQGLRSLGVEIEAVAEIGIEVTVEQLDDGAGEVALFPLGVFDPDQDLVLLGLVKSLQRGRPGFEIHHAVAKLTEIGFAAELHRDLRATDKVDPEVEAGSEKLVRQPTEDDEHG